MEIKKFPKGDFLMDSNFKKNLVAFYESNDISDISDFLKENCWKR